MANLEFMHGKHLRKDAEERKIDHKKTITYQCDTAARESSMTLGHTKQEK